MHCSDAMPCCVVKLLALILFAVFALNIPVSVARTAASAREQPAFPHSACVTIEST
jgi:hypothetical protein